MMDGVNNSLSNRSEDTISLKNLDCSIGANRHDDSLNAELNLNEPSQDQVNVYSANINDSISQHLLQFNGSNYPDTNCVSFSEVCCLF